SVSSSAGGSSGPVRKGARAGPPGRGAEWRRRPDRSRALPQIVERQSPAAHNRGTRQCAVAIGIEYKAERDGDAVDRSRQPLVTVRQAFSQRTDLGAAGTRSEPAG